MKKMYYFFRAWINGGLQVSSIKHATLEEVKQEIDNTQGWVYFHYFESETECIAYRNQLIETICY